MVYYDHRKEAFSTHSNFNLNKSSDPRAIHAQVIKSNITTNIAIFNNLITHYFKSNLSSYAYTLFHQIPSPNVVTWTALITANSNTLLSLHHFLSMLRHSTLPTHRTITSLFATCASLSSLSFGLSLHSLSLKLALSHHPFSASSLVTFYSKCKLPTHALKVFDETPQRDNVSYSAIIVALAKNFCYSDALMLFADMRFQGFDSTEHSVSGGLRAAAQLAALEQCRIIHAHAVVVGLDSNVVVATSLVDGYSKTGYVPVWSELLHNVGEEKRKEALWNHSEKLAVAFGVLCGSVPPGDADKEDRLQHYTQTAGGLRLAQQSRYDKVIGKFSSSLNYYYL
ncbi:hypothetical protein TSUD_67000 [Trifolium subterraneum]|uniref:DYW domain-containing protein n=1 Tax=Trifolium subterraneum TaxID=3900 RepID=A0A2Z6NE24_TRISU|nr:hypothetical protein TSUD_67000 [Trifolium subterraneum]